MIRSKVNIDEYLEVMVTIVNCYFCYINNYCNAEAHHNFIVYFLDEIPPVNITKNYFLNKFKPYLILT